jgi:hypothetical protein
MDREAIAARAEKLKDEINAISMPLSTAGGIAVFKQARRIMNDVAVLLRELAESKCK